MLTRQITRFLTIGGIATIFNYSVFYILYRYAAVNYLVASGTGFFSGVILGYQFNKNWTFGSDDSSVRSILKYLSVYIGSLILSLVILKIEVEVLKVEVKIANVIVIGITTVTNFIGTKYLVFKK